MLSCTSESPSDVKPIDLISEDKMVDVMIDMHMTESALSLKNFNRDSSLKLFVFYKDDIYKEHQMTEKQFKDSYEYYSQHSKEFNAMYARIVDSLSVKEVTGKLK
jgi:hypothetical protein